MISEELLSGPALFTSEGEGALQGQRPPLGPRGSERGLAQDVSHCRHMALVLGPTDRRERPAARLPQRLRGPEQPARPRRTGYPRRGWVPPQRVVVPAFL